MEDEKKKKKNKKKKNKQANKQTENVTLEATESTSDSQERGQNSNDQEAGIADAPNDVRAHANADRDGSLANGTEVTNFTEADKRNWLDREAIFEHKVKDLQAEKDSQMQKEALLEEKIRQLMKEKDGNSEKEASLKEKMKQLLDEKNASLQTEASLKKKFLQLEYEKEELIQKEGSLQQKIQQLQREIDGHMQKESSLETKILQLEGEKVSLVKKEAGFEAKTNQLADEAALLNLKAVSLEEKIKQMERERESWIRKENSANESIANLTNWNTKLQAQVMELEQSRESLLSETQQLKEFISTLQLRISNLEMDNKVTSENGDAKYQVEAARALVDKLVAENSDLVGKVNELYAMLGQRGVRTDQIFSVGLHPGAVTARSTDTSNGPDFTPNVAIGADDRQISEITAYHTSDSISKASKTIPLSESTQSLEDVMIKDQRNGELVSVNNGSGVSYSSEILEEDEIVQIPLDENEVEEANLEVTRNDEEIDVPLTASPLIGAPFRFVSFVARYVSGADLVDKNAGKPG